MNNIWKTIIGLLEQHPGISELETNGSLSIFTKVGSKREEIEDSFNSVEEYRNSVYNELIREILEIEGETDYLVEGSLKVGESTARCHIVLPPASEEPLVTIARKSQSLKEIDNFVRTKTMSPEMADFLRKAVDNRLTIVISGSTGAGKTTLLEALTKRWPHNLRMGIVEDLPELDLVQPNVVYLKSAVRKPGQSEEDIATLKWCVDQLNRMRVDYIIVGETRGAEFASFLTAANSGCEGSLTTIHASNPRMALQKMNQFVNMAYPSMPQRTINRNIANTVDLVVQLEKKNGRYLCTSIEEITEHMSSAESADITTQNIFAYNKETDQWDKQIMSDQLRTKLGEVL